MLEAPEDEPLIEDEEEKEEASVVASRVPPSVDVFSDGRTAVLLTAKDLTPMQMGKDDRKVIHEKYENLYRTKKKYFCVHAGRLWL